MLSGVEKVGEQFPVVDVKLEEGLTAPPDYLTESELITLVVFLKISHSHEHTQQVNTHTHARTCARHTIH